MSRPTRLLPSLHGLRRERGLYALEWALVFPLFFVLLYAIIAFGIVFTVRMSLQFAAEEGARAALRYQSTAAGRLDKAGEVARSAADWLPSSALTVDTRFCALDGSGDCVSFGGASPCTGLAPAVLCQVSVTVKYAWSGAGTFAPALPGLGLVLPEVLSGEATVPLGGSAS